MVALKRNLNNLFIVLSLSVFNVNSQILFKFEYNNDSDSGTIILERQYLNVNQSYINYVSKDSLTPLFLTGEPFILFARGDFSITRNGILKIGANYKVVYNKIMKIKWGGEWSKMKLYKMKIHENYYYISPILGIVGIDVVNDNNTYKVRLVNINEKSITIFYEKLKKNIKKQLKFIER